jgi:hypothetical protein
MSKPWINNFASTLPLPSFSSSYCIYVLNREIQQEKSTGMSGDKASRKQALKSSDAAAVAISKSKQSNAKKLGFS